MNNIKLAFYKGKGNLIDKAIRFWTKGSYSHVELIVDDIWYSISPRDTKVRAKKMIPKKQNWDYVQISKTSDDVKFILDHYENTKGSKYDWLGIFLSQFLKLNIQNNKRYFCSEWCAAALRIDKAHKYNPNNLYKYIKKGE
jgi:hypothetical protein